MKLNMEVAKNSDMVDKCSDKSNGYMVYDLAKHVDDKKADTLLASALYQTALATGDISSDKDKIVALNRYGWALLRTDHKGEAVAPLEEAATKIIAGNHRRFTDPFPAVVVNNYGMAEEHAGNAVKAMKAYEVAAKFGYVKAEANYERVSAIVESTGRFHQR
jgi:tetratricopeptide (TPR) repeat protein